MIVTFSNVLEKPRTRDVVSSLLVDRVARVCRDHGDAVALVLGDERITYRDLGGRVNRLARLLIERGVGPETVVPVAFEASVERIVAMLGVITAGGAYLPLDVEAPPARNASLVRDSEAALVLTSTRSRDRLGPSFGENTLVIDSGRTVSAMAAFADAPVDQLERITPLAPQNLAYVIYTSGSTGKPKGVCNSHAGIATSLDWLIATLGIKSADIAVHRTDYTFDVSVWEIFSVLTVGGTLVLLEPGGALNSAHVAEVVAQNGATLMFFVPTMLKEFVESESDADGRSIRNICALGEAFPGSLQQRVHDRYPHVDLWNGYGPTEAAVGVTLWQCRREDAAKAPPIGSPASNTQIHILDEALQPTPDGEAGEIYIAGDYLARGYLGMPELTAEKFIPCPFGEPGGRMYKSGDLAERRADGEIYFLGRNDGQVKLNGVRIELGEIEGALIALEGIARAAVISRPLGGEDRLVAYLIMKPGAPLNVAKIRSTLGETLPRHLVPSLFVAVDAFPLTTSGKLNSKALPDPDTAVVQKTYREPSGDLETFFATTFAQLTGVARVGADESFFALGGTSLSAMRLASRTKSRLGLVLPMRAMIENPTPAGLAIVMERLRAGQEAFTPAPPDGRPILFVLPGAGGADVSLGEFAIACDPVLDVRILDYDDWSKLCARGVTFGTWAESLAARMVEAVPSGDINLTGYSLGGDLAYEVARNLRRRGRWVRFLGIIDTGAPALRGGRLSFAQKVKRIGPKIAHLVRNRELSLAASKNLLAMAPPSLLPTVAAALTLGSGERREDLDGRMRVTIGDALRAPWLGTVANDAPLDTPTRLFRVKADAIDEGRFDGWRDRCSNVVSVQVEGDHLTVLAAAHLKSFVDIFLRETQSVLGQPEREIAAAAA